MRKIILFTTALLAGALTSTASITVQAWYHLGEPGTIAGGALPVDSSGNGHNMNDGFSEFESVHSIPNSPGGPLGTSGYISTASSEWGRNGDVVIAAADGYAVTGDNFGIEAWVLPYGEGYNVFCCESAQHFTAVLYGSGGYSTGFVLGVTNNQDGTYAFVANVIDDLGNFLKVGDTVPLITNAWTHLAVVRNNGTNTFYVNGIANGASTTDAPSTNLPTSGNQNGMVLGASRDDQVAYRGLIDEARAFTFGAGQFSLTNLLYPSASLTTPFIVTQPVNTIVWDGGAAPFSLQVATSSTLTYQWKRNGSSISGATKSTLLLPLVTRSADNGSVYNCVVTNTSSSQFTTSSNANLSVAFVQSNNVANYHSLVTAQPSLVAYFPVDYNTNATLTNSRFAANSGQLEGNAAYDSRTDRAFGQRALALDRGNNLGDVTLANDPDYSFLAGVGAFEAIVYMSDLGVYINQGGWSFPTIFSVGEADRTIPAFTFLVGVSKVGDALEFSDGSSTLSWPVSRNFLNRFAHVTLVFDQAAGVTAYVDGRSLGTQGTFTPLFSGSPAWIGCAGSYTNAFTGPVWNGTIDEVALYTNTLSANTIAAHYAMFTYGTNTPPVVLSPPSPVTILSGASNSTAIFGVDAEGTYPLSYQWKSNGVPIAGANSNLLAISNAVPSYSATYSVTISNSAGTTNVAATLSVITPIGYAAAVTADSPLAYWRLGERGGSTALDSWGIYNGTYIQTITYGVPGALPRDADTAVGFDGTSAEVQIPYTPDLNTGGPFTAEAWIKPLEVPPAINPAGALASLNFNSGRSGWLLYQFNNNFNLRLGDASGYTFNQVGSAVLQPNNWYYVAVVYDGINATLYVNGVVDTTGPVSSFAANVVAPFEIGAASGVGRFVRDQIDEVAFYNSALTTDRILAHYYAGQPPRILVTRSGGNVVLTWPTGVLYQADNVSGPYTIVTGATSPLTVTPSAARKFYLLRAQ
jgi:hypothetical protein